MVAVEATAAMPGHGSQGTGEESTREGWIYCWNTDATEESKAAAEGTDWREESRAAAGVRCGWATLSG